MKILIFSDTHLTDQFEEKKYHLLKKIVGDVDRVIINGDFWDGYLTTFDKFVNSPWKKLFPLLKSKKAIYIFGNHEKKSYSDNRVSLFSIEQKDRHVLRIDPYTFLIEHGNLIYPVFDETIIKSRFLNKLAVMFIAPILREAHFLSYFNKRANRLIKKKIGRESKDKGIFVLGHTHAPEVDIEAGYVNSGVFHRGLAQYLIIDDGKIIPKEDRYD